MSKTDKIEIQLSGVKKKYKLGQIGARTLRGDIKEWAAKKRGEENPYAKIGQDTSNFGKEFYALDGVDLTIYKGERVGIIGSNGAGKSTLLKLLSQVTAPTEGDIDLYGRVSSMLEVGTGFHGEMTGRENIYMNGAILGMSREEIDFKIEDIIDFSEVRQFIDTPVKRYSSGMFVKLAFAVAAHLDSEIMIMDEVLAVGDMAFQQKCLDKMREAADKEGRTVLYVSHNMNTIRRLCERVVVLDKGKIIFDGDVEEGIAVYMNNNIEENEVEIDLTKKSHAGKDIDTGLCMEHLTILDKAVPTFSQDEDLKLSVKLQITKPVSDVKFRVTFRTDSDTGVGTGWCGETKSFEPGEVTVPLSVSLSQFVKGKFYVSIGAYNENAAGQTVLLDHITRAFKIEVLGPVTWNTTAHGYIKIDMK